MAQHDEPIRTRVPPEAAMRGAGARPQPARNERCPGAAVQLAAVHRTLRQGPVLQLEAGGANRTGLPDRLKSGVEALSGVSLDGVKVHYNSPEPAQLNALAYAQGTDIHLAPGQERHLPHEAWHVVQQAQGRVKPTMQMKSGVAINDEAALEHEADVMGARAAAGAPRREVPALEPLAAPVAQRRGVVQRLIAIVHPATALTAQERNWNGLRNFAATLPDAAETAIDTYADAHEADMGGNFNAQVQALYGLRSAILEALDDVKMDEEGHRNLDWDEIWDFVNDDLTETGLLRAVQTAGLGGGHGDAGFRWSVFRVRDNHRIAMGSVPDSNNQHGRTMRALRGTRGTVHTAIVGHNAEVDHYRGLAEALPYT